MECHATPFDISNVGIEFAIVHTSLNEKQFKGSYVVLYTSG